MHAQEKYPVSAGYSLRQLAQDDLESIRLYSYREWGAEQADQDIQSLLSRFDWLSENPQPGKQRPEIKPGYYYFPEGMHLIFYKVIRSGIDIIGIPHQSMDIAGHFDV